MGVSPVSDWWGTPIRAGWGTFPHWDWMGVPQKGHGTRHWVPLLPGKDMGPVDGSIMGWIWGTMPGVDKHAPVKTVPSPFLRNAGGNDKDFWQFYDLMKIFFLLHRRSFVGH